MPDGATSLQTVVEVAHPLAKPFGSFSTLRFPANQDDSFRIHRRVLFFGCVVDIGNRKGARRGQGRVAWRKEKENPSSSRGPVAGLSPSRGLRIGETEGVKGGTATDNASAVSRYSERPLVGAS